MRECRHEGEGESKALTHGAVIARGNARIVKNCTLCQLSEVVARNAAGVEFDPISATTRATYQRMTHELRQLRAEFRAMVQDVSRPTLLVSLEVRRICGEFKHRKVLECNKRTNGTPRKASELPFAH